MFDPVLFAALMSSTAAFTPLSLFAAGEQGAWYDPSDLTTMFTDAAGTTPVTAVEQPVGLLLDKSKGLALGAELVGATWAVSDATWSQTGSTLTAVNGSSFSCYQNIITAGRWYKVSFEIFDYASGSISVRLGNAGGIAGFSASANGTYTAIGLSVGDSNFYWMGGGTFNGKIRNITVKVLAGNHASQSTAASRPVLSARVNLLTRSEEFDNAVWSKGGLVTAGMANVTTAPDGTNTADQLIETNATAAHFAEQGVGTVPASTNYTASVAVKQNGRQYVTVAFTGVTATLWAAATFDLSGTGSVSKTGNGSGSTYVSSSITPIGNGWFRCSVTGSHLSSTTGLITIQPSDSGTPTYGSYSAHSYAGNGTSGIYLWGADLRVTNVGVNLPAYQRVGAAVTATTNPAVTGVPDYDTSGFPLYLKFDGVDDSLATGTINFSATDKMSVFAGVRKLSDATGYTRIVEFGDAVVSDGSFAVNAPAASSTQTYEFALRGTATTAFSAATYSAPCTSVITSSLNIAGISRDTEITPRINGVAPTLTGTGDPNAGTGNFGNYPLYIGRRGGSTLPFNGNVYSLIVRGALSTDAQIASTETYVNNLTKAY